MHLPLGIICLKVFERVVVAKLLRWIFPRMQVKLRPGKHCVPLLLVEPRSVLRKEIDFP